MVQEEVIKIGGVEVVLHFRFSTLYELGRKWGLKSVNAILEKIVSTSFENGDNDISLDVVDIYSDIVIICSDKELDRKEVMDYLFNNPGIVATIAELIIESIQGDKKEDQAEEKKAEDSGK